LKYIKKTLKKLSELRKAGILSSSRPVWLDLNHQDPRTLVDFNTFKNKLVNTALEDVVIYQNSSIPITFVDLSLKNIPLKLLLSVRPSTPDELNSYFDNQKVSNPFEDLKELNLTSEKISLAYLNRLKDLQSNDNFNLPTMFQPHIRGLYIGSMNNDNTYLYIPLNLVSKQSVSKNEYVMVFNSDLIQQLDSCLKEKNLSYIKLLPYELSVKDRVKKTYKDLYEKGFIATKKNHGYISQNNDSLERKIETFSADSFLTKKIDVSKTSYVSIFNFKNKLKQNLSMWSYLPLQIKLDEDRHKTIPFLIVNNVHVDNQHISLPTIVGVYAAKKYFEKSFVESISLLNPNFTNYVSQRASQELNIGVNTLFLKRSKGNSFLKKPSYKEDKNEFRKYSYDIDDSYW